MKVIVAVDQTDYANQIIDSVIRHRWPENTWFKLITVLEPHQWEEVDRQKWQKLAGEIFAQREEIALGVLSQARSKLQENVADCSVHIEVRKGSAKDELLKAAVEWMPDKVTVGAHGHHPNRLFGSVPRTLTRYAPCSIELVRLKKIPEQARVEAGSRMVKAST